MVAAWAGSNQIVPFVFSALAARDNVVDSQLRSALTAILAGVIVPPEDFPLVKFYPYTRSFDHAFKPDDRRSRKLLGYRVNETAPVEDERGFTGHHQADRPPGGANIEWFEICVQN